MSDTTKPTASPLRPTDNRWDWFFLIIFSLILVFSPISFGVVEAWSEFLVVSAAVLSAFGLLLRAWRDDSFELTASWTYLPLMLVLGLICFQLVPLPSSLVNMLSSHGLQLRQQLLGADGAAINGHSALSLYPFETAHDLRMALVFSALFVVSATVFRTSMQVKRMLWVIFVVGCAEAGIALLQILTFSEKIHWMYADRHSVVTSGSFVNYSHFAQFMNLALGAGVALLLVRVKEDNRRKQSRASMLADLRSERYLRPITGLVLCGVAVFTSMSRNGVISLLIATGIVSILLYRKGILNTRSWLVGMVPWCVILVIFVTSFDVVYERFATFQDSRDLRDRAELTAATLSAWRDFPVLGTGLGTHEYVFPLYDTTASSSMAEHADNDWAQLLEEFGWLGGCAVLAFVTSVFWLAGRLMWAGRSRLSAASFGLTLGLLAVAWHSLSDFGQRLPGIFTLTALSAGLIVAISRYDLRRTSKYESGASLRSLPVGLRRGVFVLSAICLLLISWWAITTAHAASRGEAWANVAFGLEQRLQRAQWQRGDQEFADLLAAAQLAVEAEPRNAKYSYLLNLYRWRSISRERDPDTGELMLEAEALPFVDRIADELARTRQMCPFYGPPYALEGELRLLVLKDQSGARLVEQAAKLASYDAATCFAAGRLAANEGRFDDAVVQLRRAVALDARQFSDVAWVLINTLKQPDLAVELAGNRVERLMHIARQLRKAESTSEQYLEMADTLTARAALRLREMVASGEASPHQTYQLGLAELRGGNPKAAIELIRKALAQQYNQVGWRMVLARTLVSEGESKQALREAKIVLRLKPDTPGAVKLINEITASASQP